ncbi:MAG: tetratricopeptide repeat protein [Candidatus Dadabacteria bacterium]|nr:tetratricopeptide repeat protein [Candidatus Dadabacteria bacterium]MYA48985.1 tetratricopeptide repeat protein [Candidatus Dadabacteria bacterium]MYF48191.1 tetratricopeptide repeat protein [Candidatus Dadabacteria bacterium]MYK49494.1 tetratricopeptide repeat protein [Candidatus Dadabacteria bacterium]
MYPSERPACCILQLSPVTEMTTGKKKRGSSRSRMISQRDAFATLVLGVLVAVIYFPATQAGFVWDDAIMRNLVAVSTWGGIWELWFDPVGAYLEGGTRKEGHYWPLLYTTFWLEHKLWGFSPAGYHVVNILIHFANTVLLWRVLSRLAVPGAWFAAAVFAVHPLHAESVAWIMARKDMLATLFCLSSLLLWLRFTESPSRGRYAGALLLFAAAMLSKSVVVVFPAALLILQWWRNSRITRGDLLRTAPFFLVGLAIAVGDLLFYQNVQNLIPLGYSMAERVLIATHALWFYAGKLLWPVELAVIYPHWDVNIADPVGWVYVVATVAVAAALWFLRRRIGRGPLACALFFAAMLSPTLGFVDYGYMSYSFVADRYQYLAGIGLIVFFAAAAARGTGRLPDLPGKVARGAALVLLVLLGAATWNQAGVYKDEVTLFRHIISLNPDARTAHLNLAYALIHSKGGSEEALAAARIAVKKRPLYYNSHNVLGLALSKLGRYDEAEEHLRRAIELNPRYAPAFLNLGEGFRVRGRYGEALEAYLAAVRIDPDYPLPYVGMGYVFFELERYDEVVSSMKRALLLKPDLPMAPRLHFLTGKALEKLGRHDEAERHLRRARELAPKRK